MIKTRDDEYVLVDNVAADLIDRNGSTTTKEIKEELRQLYPGGWYQRTISDIMKELSDVEGKYAYTDVDDGINPTHRLYTLPISNNITVTTIDDILDDDDIPPVTTPVPRGNILHRLRRAMGGK